MKEDMKKEKSKNTLTNFGDLIRNSCRILKILWQLMPWVTFGMVALTIIMGVLPVFAAGAMGVLIDRIISAAKSGIISGVYPALIMFALLTIIPTIIRDFVKFLERHLFLRAQDHLELLALEKRGSFDIAQQEDSGFQDRLKRAFNNGIWPIINLMDGQLASLEISVGIIVGSIAAAAIDWRVFALVVITSIPDFMVEIKYGGQLWHIWAENSTEQRRYSDLRRFFEQKIPIIDGKLYQVGGKFLADIKKILSKFSGEQLAVEHWKTFLKMGASLLAAVGLFVGIAIIINEAVAGAIAIGTVVFAFQTLNRVSGWTSNLLSFTARLLERNLYVTDIFSILDEKPILKMPEKPVKLVLSEAPIVKFENVSFRYPGQRKWALRNINLELHSGEKLGLVGNNGSGKSTLVRLLLRIHDPVEGKITLNGIDLREIEINDWWNYLGVLLQDFTTYNFSVREAIAVGVPKRSIDDSLVLSSAKKSTSASFIGELEDGYENMIGVEFGGIEPSKGQRQKLAIARALYKGKLVLILDEPTASVDAESASIIFQEIESLPENISAILISHNFATIKRANKIIVLDNGKIVEEGNHENLLAKNGLYSEMYARQKGEYQ